MKGELIAQLDNLRDAIVQLKTENEDQGGKIHKAEEEIEKLKAQVALLTRNKPATWTDSLESIVREFSALRKGTLQVKKHICLHLLP